MLRGGSYKQIVSEHDDELREVTRGYAVASGGKGSVQMDAYIRHHATFTVS
jgi:hypothetical protein